MWLVESFIFDTKTLWALFYTTNQFFCVTFIDFYQHVITQFNYNLFVIILVRRRECLRAWKILAWRKGFSASPGSPASPAPSPAPAPPPRSGAWSIQTLPGRPSLPKQHPGRKIYLHSIHEGEERKYSLTHKCSQTYIYIAYPGKNQFLHETFWRHCVQCTYPQSENCTGSTVFIVEHKLLYTKTRD